MYTHVTITLRYGRIGAFLETMPRIKAIVEAAGWELLHALTTLDGPLYTVLHIWRLRDMNHYAEGIEVLTAHPEFPELAAALVGVVDSETIVFAQDLPYAPGASS